MESDFSSVGRAFDCSSLAPLKEGIVGIKLSLVRFRQVGNTLENILIKIYL